MSKRGGESSVDNSQSSELKKSSRIAQQQEKKPRPEGAPSIYVDQEEVENRRIVRRMADRRRREKRKPPDPFTYCEIPQLTSRGMERSPKITIKRSSRIAEIKVKNPTPEGAPSKYVNPAEIEYKSPTPLRSETAKRSRTGFLYLLPGLVWDEIELGANESSKGTGLFAKKDLPKDLCIPYGGIYRSPQEQKTLVRQSNDRDRHLTSHGASVRKQTAEGTHEWGMQDAHPRIMQERESRQQGRGQAATVTKSTSLRRTNAELLQHEGRCTAPSYDWMDEQCHNLFVRLQRPVLAGEEILVDYAYSARKQTVLGFGFKAKRPKVSSEYELRPRCHASGKEYGEVEVRD
eukprot:gene37246-48693_t